MIHFATYTAVHGLAWRYNEKAIAYADIDRCRTAFGALPDFSLRERGFEGVLVRGDAVFVARCFCAPKWDFLGRDALYLAVAWFSKSEMRNGLIGHLLQCAELLEPMRDPPSEIKIESIGGCPADSLDLFTDGVYKREIGAKSFVRLQASSLPKPNLGGCGDENGAFNRPVQQQGKVMKPVWCYVVTVVVIVILLGLVALDYFATKKESDNDGSGKVPSGNQVREEANTKNIKPDARNQLLEE